MELYTIPITDVNHDVFIIYRPLLGLAFVGNKTMAELAKSLAEDPNQPIDEKVYTFLKQVGFLQPDPPAPKFPPKSEFRPISLTLLMTNQCQLRCKYCYAAAGELPDRHLSLETGITAIDYTYQNIKRLNYPKLHISLHGGGEPTLPWDTMKALVMYARKKPIPTEIVLTSNGIWSPQQRKWIIENVDYVGISIDGRPQTQDAQRPLSSGEGSSAYVMQTIHELEANRRPYRLRLTALPPFDGLAEDVRFLCEQTMCTYMQVEAAFSPKRGEGYNYNLEEGLQFLQAFLTAQDVAEQYNRHLRCVGSNVTQVTAVSCGALFNTFSVTPQNNIVACSEIVNDNHPLANISTIGRISPHGVIIDEDARANLRQKIAERRSTCRECPCYWSCAGGCLPRTFSPRPNGHLEHSAHCELRRILQKELLLKHIAKGNGVWMKTQVSRRCTTPRPQ